MSFSARLHKAFNALFETEEAAFSTQLASDGDSQNWLSSETFSEPETPDDIEIGMYVVDRMAGIKGWVVARRETISGMIQYAIQRATLKGFGILHAEFTDWNNLAIYDDVTLLNVVEPVNPEYIKLGDWVKESFSDLEGVVMEKLTHQNGCVTVKVEYKDPAKEGRVLCDDIHANRLELVADKKPFQLPSRPEPTPVGTGGFGEPMARL